MERFCFLFLDSAIHQENNNRILEQPNLKHQSNQCSVAVGSAVNSHVSALNPLLKPTTTSEGTSIKNVIICTNLFAKINDTKKTINKVRELF